MKRLILAFLCLMFSIYPSFAAIDLDGGGDYYNAAFTVPSRPWTVCAIAAPDSETTNRVIFSIGVATTATNRWEMLSRGAVAGDPFRFALKASGCAFQVDTSGVDFAAGTFYQVCIVEVSATDHKVYVDGGNSGSSSTPCSPTGTDEVKIGERAGTETATFDGDVSEVALWDKELSAAEISTLYNSGTFLPATCVANANLQYYWTLTDTTDLTDSVSSLTLTENGNPVTSTHPTLASTCPGSGSISPGFFLMGK